VEKMMMLGMWSVQLIQSVCTAQKLYAKAALVNHERLAALQKAMQSSGS
jgi:L-rhamnose isomerase